MSGYSEWTVTVVSDDGEWVSEGVVSPGLEGLMLLISAVRPVDRGDIRFYLHFLLVDE